MLYLIILRIKTLLDVYFFHHQTYQILRCSSPGRSKKEVALGLSFVFSRRVKCNYDYIVIVTSWSPRPPFSSCFATGYRLGVAVYYRLWQSHYVFALFQWENITSKQKSATCYLTHSISAILHSSDISCLFDEMFKQNTLIWNNSHTKWKAKKLPMNMFSYYYIEHFIKHKPHIFEEWNLDSHRTVAVFLVCI